MSKIITSIRRCAKYSISVLKSEPPRLIYVSGWLGHKNLGDEVLFEAYKKLFYKCSFVQYSHFGGRALSMLNKIFNISGYAILGGGTLINDKTFLPGIKECVNIFPRTYVFGTGVTHPIVWSKSPDRTDNIGEWKSILERCDYVGVRGPLSAKLLRDNNINNVDIIGDPVLALANKKYNTKKLSLPNSIGLNIGETFGGYLWGSKESICEEYIKLASMAKKNGWKVKWFVVFPSDLSITREVAIKSKTTDEIYEVYDSYERYLELASSLNVFIGMKLHSVVLANCAYVPSLMVEYRPKCRDYMSLIGQEKYNIRMDRFKAEDVWGIIVDINNNRGILSEILYNTIKPLREKQRSKAEELMSAIERHYHEQC